MAYPDAKALLRSAGFKVTPGRVALVELLARESKPLPVAEIQHKLKNLDGVTVYRALEALQGAGLVVRVELGHGHAHFELVAGKPHHHHAVCADCGTVEDVECNVQDMAPPGSKKFKTIYSHNIEFFGSCVSCTK